MSSISTNNSQPSGLKSPLSDDFLKGLHQVESSAANVPGAGETEAKNATQDLKSALGNITEAGKKTVHAVDVEQAKDGFETVGRGAKDTAKDAAANARAKAKSAGVKASQAAQTAGHAAKGAATTASSYLTMPFTYAADKAVAFKTSVIDTPRAAHVASMKWPLAGVVLGSAGYALSQAASWTVAACLTAPAAFAGMGLASAAWLGSKMLARVWNGPTIPAGLTAQASTAPTLATMRDMEALVRDCKTLKADSESLAENKEAEIQKELNAAQSAAEKSAEKIATLKNEQALAQKNAQVVAEAEAVLKVATLTESAKVEAIAPVVVTEEAHTSSEVASEVMYSTQKINLGKVSANN